MYIYIHLPFCLSHCIYCDFYVELKATESRRRSYLDALKQEITHYLGQQPELPPIQTLYLGGGTPALFPASEIGEVLDCLATFAPFSPEAEITLEANPEGMASPPAEYRQIGINRLSVGVQSLQPHELKRLSRVHSRDQVYHFIEAVKTAGFDNLSIDLMYGIPEQTAESWQDTLAQAVSLGVTHVSMYGLKVEEATALARLIDQGRMSVPVDDDTVAMYFQAVDFLEQHSFAQYEISNLACPGRESQHNLRYWNNEEFWGFGVSAHGYMHGQRYENPRDLQRYLADPTRREEVNGCTPQEQLENALIFGLRKRSGISISAIEEHYQLDFNQRYGNALARYFEHGYLIREGDILKLHPKAVPVSNEILAAFID